MWENCHFKLVMWSLFFSWSRSWDFYMEPYENHYISIKRVLYVLCGYIILGMAFVIRDRHVKFYNKIFHNTTGLCYVFWTQHKRMESEVGIYSMFFYIKKSIFWYQKIFFYIKKLISKNWFFDIRNWFFDIRKWISDIKKYFLISKNGNLFYIKKISLIFWYQKMNFWYQKFIFWYQKIVLIFRYQKIIFWYQKFIFLYQKIIFWYKKISTIFWYKKVQNKFPLRTLLFDIKKHWINSHFAFHRVPIHSARACDK